MNTGVRNTLIAIAGFIALVLGLFFSAYLTNRGQLTEAQYRELGYFRFDEPRVIAPFHLTNESGDAVGLDSLKGQWSLLFFGFTYCPDICPTTMGVLNRAVERLDTDPQVVLVSVDPERDSPEKLSVYLSAFNPVFKGYTGDFDEIVRFATGVNVAFGKVPGPEPGTYTVDHSVSIVVVDPDGHYAGFIKAPHDALRIKQIVESLI